MTVFTGPAGELTRADSAGPLPGKGRHMLRTSEMRRYMAAAFGWGTLAARSLVIGALAALWFRISLRVIGTAGLGQ